MLLFSQCDLQAFGLKNWRDKSADTQNNGLLSQIHATKVSTTTKLKSSVLYSQSIELEFGKILCSSVCFRNVKWF